MPCESVWVVETGEPPAPVRRGVWLALAQVGLAGVVGGVFALLGTGVVVAMVFGGSSMGYLAALVLFVLLVALLMAVARVAPEASLLTRTRGGRLFWGVAVGGAGFGLWLLAWQVSDEAGLGFSKFPLLSVVPFTLVAGVLLRRWYLALGFLAVSVTLALVLLHALAAALPSDVDQRLAAAQLARESIVVTSVPGYHALPQLKSWQLEPDGADPYPPSPYVTLYSLVDTPGPDCAFDESDSRFPAVLTCTAERPGLAYIDGAAVTNAYIHRVAGTQLLLTAPKYVDRAVLRDAILAARATDPPGTFTTTIPGYTVESANPSGTSFIPDDRTLLPGSGTIQVHTRPAPTSDDCPSTCERETPTLRYERDAYIHQYVLRTGPLEIIVQGGLAVPRDTLRTATQTAHPATDDDLRLILPPAPPSRTQSHSPLESIRSLARTLFGP
ncbi:hypothetical protein Aglo03_20270 [Actinokineospora globicatena]|uniref:Uncharacterized protein n=1 Tax=Actinokineospora globicatena TaxID=103729 RepID=A0A9W6QJI9_9PSEU|nr:hypothetical protein Aglo03_20270 [Actinokineospora globicatena]